MILGIIKKFLTSPLSFDNKLKVILRFIKWQISQRIFLTTVIYQYTENSKILVKKGMTGVTGNLYYGLDEFNDGIFFCIFKKRGCIC